MGMLNQKTHFLLLLEFFLYFTFDDFLASILPNIFPIPVRLGLRSSSSETSQVYTNKDTYDFSKVV